MSFNVVNGKSEREFEKERLSNETKIVDEHERQQTR